ncbi:MAG: nitroreductase family deazaflavin-dependent oxidoreductase [Mycolicibacterium sp.]|uniref:Nitroreductase family deazaflavin-dependent oxidoreductase n=1 Tax=Mycolicibacter arupensis TaxID=342002 RepID=A0A5C7XK69_9MYCO|nr:MULTISPECIES: nitroreductase family deazaflavin-dependent oxidoreductase [Mycobacteriaceae]RUP29669.1 MAG: nitroreductase family deazaflavin-dependent oxidoreductase [Mycolicibacterium sp.]TXI49847.1 MAG: nitroreductase family deazaflavin-dependent oxidoreductase [Mycolicibacter arupensis]SHW05333.1 deazaflavin-dependent nitroreductase family protein [Mycobacteroides abscessus subsp. abscessus]
MSSRQDHPNNAAGVPMIFPVWLENFQIKYINPVVSPLAKKLPGFTVVKHRGRKSGKQFETTVNSFRKGDVLAIGLLHGKTNWVKNVLAAGEADMCVSGTDLHVVNPRVLPAGTVDPSLPRIAQLVAKRSGVFVADVAH